MKFLKSKAEKAIIFGALGIPAISKRSRAKQVSGDFSLWAVLQLICKQQWMEPRPAQSSLSTALIVEAMPGRIHHLMLSLFWVLVPDAQGHLAPGHKEFGKH